MVGVIANDSDAPVVHEFFELFKTPWEYYESERFYDVVLISEGRDIPGSSARVLIHYSTSETPVDFDGKVELQTRARNLSYKGWRIPIYGASATFHNAQTVFLTDGATSLPVGYQSKVQDRLYCRIGYDLFREVRTLLTSGQPPENASIPAIELHIALLRDLMVSAGVTFVEVPPVPENFAFIACLTHDVDHPAIRLHKWDHTLFGFLYRAIWDSLIQVFKGRRPIRYLVDNYVAVVKVPFVHLGMAKDFWGNFRRYTELEDGSPSTYFVLPFKGRAGTTVSGPAPQFRASSYGAADIADSLEALRISGMEIGLHGIDAWIDSSKGQEEKAQIAKTTGGTCTGVRMHWLYFGDDSYETLEKSGFAYDSTIGYNQTIGFRTGTTQVYKPLQAKRLLEIPLHIMDTALFYPSYMNLTFKDADSKVGHVVDTTARFGGVVTFNWHDRSIAPERCWGQFYAKLIRSLKEKGSWCTSAGSAVAWFQDRRSVCFKRVSQGIELSRAASEWRSGKDGPGLRLRVYNSCKRDGASSKEYADLSFTHDMTIDRDGAVSQIANS